MNQCGRQMKILTRKNRIIEKMANNIRIHFFNVTGFVYLLYGCSSILLKNHVTFIDGQISHT